MKLTFAILLCAALSLPALAAGEPRRPPIVGLSHLALYVHDPDGTRVKLVESRTVDGIPAPPSTAPPPKDPAQ